jgi:DNA-binding protein
MSETNNVMIGKKPVMNYVLACLTLFQNGSEEVTIKARGRSISRAVDVAQIAINRYVNDVSVKKINIDTEQIKSFETGDISNVSSIEIKIGK